ncbi:response regulator [Desulfosudis oleivorans]|uniref:Response regulator receiver protein n=1 Tax=Desulfosudis oleivorans (strain DSM 6200 / JCM 39069 / Hxd3) TaxID=96561 RepID=A8ZV49_DESOH|nr:response regulator [Desulfosudis oleivorans]ABW68139.1 response regulator receiver protein [Desulfosudis oleivorans Hxd3]
MSTLAIFSATFCNAEAVIEACRERTGHRLVTDDALVADAARLSGLSEKKIENAFAAKASVFNPFTHEKERAVAYLRLALADLLDADNLIVSGFASLLIPPDITHVLRVCLVADAKFRVETVRQQKKMSEKDAAALIRKHTEQAATWVKAAKGDEDPWQSELYDMVVPMDKTAPEQAAELIVQHLGADVVQPTTRSRQAVADFQLAARAGEVLAKAGHNVSTHARDGKVTITINKHVLMLARLEEELKALVEKVPDVKGVETRVGENFYQTDIYRKYDFQMPSKVLLVDDEREFVQTLSERLIMRDMGSAVAYDGESALNMVAEEEPEVMILDLKMPGIDGIEVLRKVKATRPDIEVIILTGHGSEADKKVCMELGAFAYLHKPVDIDVLSDTLKQANEKVQQRKLATGGNA